MSQYIALFLVAAIVLIYLVWGADFFAALNQDRINAELEEKIAESAFRGQPLWLVWKNNNTIASRKTILEVSIILKTEGGQYLHFNSMSFQPAFLQEIPEERAMSIIGLHPQYTLKEPLLLGHKPV